MKQAIYDRLNDNLSRVENLVSIYGNIAARRQGRKPAKSADVLRAATVLLHASMEEFLRMLAEWRLPLAGQRVLDDVPLVGQRGRAEKFNLGSLVPHRGKNVNDVIEESVKGYLARSNYNDVGEIVTLLRNLDLPNELPDEIPSSLGELMARRHNIVHRADAVVVTGRGNHKIQTIAIKDISRWIQAVRQLSSWLEPNLPD